MIRRLLRALRCVLRGHADHLQIDLDLNHSTHSLVLACVDCGRVSPSWNVEPSFDFKTQRAVRIVGRVTAFRSRGRKRA